MRTMAGATFGIAPMNARAATATDRATVNVLARSASAYEEGSDESGKQCACAECRVQESRAAGPHVQEADGENDAEQVEGPDEHEIEGVKSKQDPDLRDCVAATARLERAPVRIAAKARRAREIGPATEPSLFSTAGRVLTCPRRTKFRLRVRSRLATRNIAVAAHHRGRSHCQHRPHAKPGGRRPPQGRRRAPAPSVQPLITLAAVISSAVRTIAGRRAACGGRVIVRLSDVSGARAEHNDSRCA